MRLFVLAISIPTLVLIFASKLFEARSSLGASGFGSGTMQIVTGTAIISTLGFSGIWMILVSIIPVLSILVFRQERDVGYALSLYTLPLSKREFFFVKTATVYLLSLLVTYIPIFFVILITQADNWGALTKVMSSGNFVSAMILVLYFVLYSVAVSIVVSLTFRNAFLDFLVSFFILAVPNFIGLSVPPFRFINRIVMLVLTTPDTSKIAKTEFFAGVVVPAILLLVGIVMIERRDVL
ncbi:hypothetical membrane protein, conserved [Thermococcus onnurineus NA1]|uniref:Hypothetical membrane protein, conserved n=2 Tax=Thermococcus onnurineus TaxID=342948 RepID=B6YWR0_THEON|nr:hypothetical membrane protein, conserved [Thermococcus onnurineus NA1]